MSPVKHHLHNIIYFEGITQAEINYVTDHSLLNTFKAGEIIFLEGDRAEGLWIVEQGRVKVYKLNENGNEHILHLLGPGKTFNDIGALDTGSNPANAAALSDTVKVWLVPTDIITSVLSRNPQVALNVIRVLAARVRSLVGQIEDLTLYSVMSRLARFLLKQVDDPSLSGPGVTRTAIAAHLNTTPQTISVALRELETSGAIEFDRHQIQITDEDKLRAIAFL